MSREELLRVFGICRFAVDQGECKVVGEWAYGENELGRGHMVVRERSGLLLGGTDPRSDGYVLVA